MTIHLPSGIWCPDDASPLQRLVMQNLAKANIGSPYGERKMLAAWLIGDEKTDHGDLHQLARHMIESLPAEVWIARGGCGGEDVVAFWTHEGYEEARDRVLTTFGVQDDRLWPIIERVPLSKR